MSVTKVSPGVPLTVTGAEGCSSHAEIFKEVVWSQTQSHPSSNSLANTLSHSFYGNALLSFILTVHKTNPYYTKHRNPQIGFFVLQTGIHRDSFLLNWFKPSGLGIPRTVNGEFRSEECLCLAWQAQHMLIWKTEQETTELNLAESHLGRGKVYGWDRNLLPIKDVFTKQVWRTYHSALSHPSSSEGPIKATSEITTGLPVKKTSNAWARTGRDWKLGGKQSHLYLQATRMQQFTALLWAARWTHFFMVDIWQ